MEQKPKPTSELVFYQTADGRTRLEVKLVNESVWLSLNQMTDLFQRDKSVISKHIKNVFDEGELQADSVVAHFATTAADGKTYQVACYNLDVIISVGYRVKSLAGTQFRIWATQRLREFIVKGFTLDDERLKQVGGAYFDELLARIRGIRASEKNSYQKIRDIYATAADYDERAEITQDFFAMAQNKLHWAIHGQTAAEVIAARANAGRPNMGLDESHRYRASSGVRAINELKPVLGLELTATPFVEGPKQAMAFKNVIYDYPLAKAMEDGFVKEPAVATQKHFDPNRFSAAEIEKIKLEDGIRLHENVKVHLETYARQTSQQIVKPFVLVIARDTTHAGELLKLIKSDGFFEGRYKEKVIQVDSSKTGAEEEEMIERLLKVEHTDEPTEIVIHVNMLKEGWDVTNLYTIVPLRAANARILIEQSIGRGLRLPYGKRTGVDAVDTLNIVAHDKFQEIIDEANQPDSAIRLKKLILDPRTDLQKIATVVSSAGVLAQLGGQSFESSSPALTQSGATRRNRSSRRKPNRESRKPHIRSFSSMSICRVPICY